jgi:hypothetical protein
MYTDNYLTNKEMPIWKCNRNQFLLRLSSLSEIVSDMIHMFYAPQERMNSRKFLEVYKKYLSWYETLPESLQLNQKSPPHVYALQ